MHGDYWRRSLCSLYKDCKPCLPDWSLACEAQHSPRHTVTQVSSKMSQANAWTLTGLQFSPPFKKKLDITCTHSSPSPFISFALWALVRLLIFLLTEAFSFTFSFMKDHVCFTLPPFQPIFKKNQCGCHVIFFNDKSSGECDYLGCVDGW